jgi:hypothetical protein
VVPDVRAFYQLKVEPLVVKVAIALCYLYIDLKTIELVFLKGLINVTVKSTYQVCEECFGTLISDNNIINR